LNAVAVDVYLSSNADGNSLLHALNSSVRQAANADYDVFMQSVSYSITALILADVDACISKKKEPRQRRAN
jgi:hypothetical protein